MSHADVGRRVDGAAFAGESTADGSRAVAMLRAFASGEVLTLEAS